MQAGNPRLGGHDTLVFGLDLVYLDGTTLEAEVDMLLLEHDLATLQDDVCRMGAQYGNPATANDAA